MTEFYKKNTNRLFNILILVLIFAFLITQYTKSKSKHSAQGMIRLAEVLDNKQLDKDQIKEELEAISSYYDDTASGQRAKLYLSSIAFKNGDRELSIHYLNGVSKKFEEYNLARLSLYLIGEEVDLLNLPKEYMKIIDSMNGKKVSPDLLDDYSKLMPEGA
jgi:predicted negative regulator of RcsB-dependent stress response